jgi:hypothetical protein
LTIITFSAYFTFGSISTIRARFTFLTFGSCACSTFLAIFTFLTFTAISATFSFITF